MTWMRWDSLSAFQLVLALLEHLDLLDVLGALLVHLEYVVVGQLRVLIRSAIGDVIAVGRVVVLLDPDVFKYGGAYLSERALF
jgi:hypothetical protein